MTAPVSNPMRARIEAELTRIETDENARILLAIESGSRAWGFHSGDSDYDVRFVYVRPVDWHLTLAPGRDVIERPLDDELDISGWDLRKALNLMLSGNAVIGEWIRSPIIYRRAPAAEDLGGLATRLLTRRPATWHYLRLLQRQKERLAGPGGGIRLKRLFYTVRPALSLRWMRLHDRAFPPMHMDALMAETDLPDDIRTEIDALITLKMSRPESGEMDTHPTAILAFIQTEAERTEGWLATPGRDEIPEADRIAAERFHQRLVKAT
ncbi:MAG: nucleotidyltransferase domain-containing protein [Pseudomonadota bacterium]